MPTQTLGRPRWNPPEGIDWTRPASHIADEHDVSVATVLTRMRELGHVVRSRGKPKGPAKPKNLKVLWSPPLNVKVDWTRPAFAIAEQLNCSGNTILRYMRRNNIPVRRWGNPGKGVDYSKVDWTRTNQFIAKELKVSPECVRAKRAALNLPPSGSLAWRLSKLAALKATQAELRKRKAA